MTVNYKIDASYELRKYLWDQFLTIGIFEEDDYWSDNLGEATFTLYATNVAEIGEMRNFMLDLFRRMDDSAADVNRFIGINNKFKFHSIFVAEISPTEPSQELQGFFSADVIIEAKYSRQVDGRGRFS